MKDADANSIAQATGADGLRAVIDGTLPEPGGTEAPDPQEPRLPETTEVGLAQTFVEEHHRDLRFVHDWKKWMVWNGQRWAEDRMGHVTNLVRQNCCEAFTKVNEPGAARAVARANTVAAVLRLASVDQRIAALPEQWDSDPWLLNTPDGTIDLRTGAMVPHDRSHHITKTTEVSPGGDCPLFMKFLAEITGDDKERQTYLQRVFGYCLTGSIREHALFFFHGGGNNGKGVLMGTVSDILSDYACTASIDVFTASNIDRHPTELARFCDKRLVTCSETERGRNWAESKIKALTGGDKIAARFMRQDFFEFLPTFKLVVAGNHKPTLQSVDEAIRRRLQLTHFNVTIPKERRDDNLRERLKAEWPGILRWLVDGCLMWQETGLQPPETVVAATTEYLEEEDTFETWLSECCEFSGSDSSSHLFGSWRDWAMAAGERPDSHKDFVRRLKERGFTSRHGNRGTIYDGLRVRPPPCAPED